MLRKRKEPKVKMSVAEALMRDMQGTAAEKLALIETASTLADRDRLLLVEHGIALGDPAMTNPVIVEEQPSVAEFIEMRRMMGSPEIDEETAKETINGAVFSVCLRDEGRLLGLARVVGDGVLYFYISDVIVRPEVRGSGYGVLLMDVVMEYLRRAAHAGAMIVVLPLKGRETFYEHCGFKQCPHGRFGVGMYLPSATETRIPGSAD